LRLVGTRNEIGCATLRRVIGDRQERFGKKVSKR